MGAYFQSTKRDYDETLVFAHLENSAAPPGLRYVGVDKNSATKGQTAAGYGQAIWKIVPDVEVTAGVRYTHETKSSDFIQPYVNPALRGTLLQGVSDIADQTFNNRSPEAT